MIKFQHNQALTSHFESFWSIVYEERQITQIYISKNYALIHVMLFYQLVANFNLFLGGNSDFAERSNGKICEDIS